MSTRARAMREARSIRETIATAAAIVFWWATFGALAFVGLGGHANGQDAAAVPHPPAPVWVTTGSLHTPRGGHTATLLRDGRVLVAGGSTFEGPQLSSVEIFDLATGAWTPAAPMTRPRSDHFAFLLPTGAVIVVGGTPTFSPENLDAEVYDPSADRWSLLPSAGIAIDATAAAMLAGGRIAVVGTPVDGHQSVLVAILDPVRQTWSVGTGDPVHRELPSAATLPDGNVLVYGGYTDSVSEDPASGAEIYDTRSGAWRPTGGPHVGRVGANGIVLADGSVLVAGGHDPDFDFGKSLQSAEVYGADGTWRLVGTLNAPRYVHTLTRLRDRHVLAAGGDVGGGIVMSGAELYDPSLGTWEYTATMNVARALHTATLLNDGSVLVVGGFQYRTGTSLDSAEIYVPPATPTPSAFRIAGIFSDQAGVYQYILLSALDRGASRSLAGRSLRVTSRIGVVKTFTFPGDPGPGDTVCIATKVIAPASGGADYTISDGFLPTIGGTIDFAGIDAWSFDAFALTGSAYVDRYAGNTGSNGLMTCTRMVVSVAVSVDPVIEYYNEELDHYFITAMQPDIDALDSRRIPGWVRTGSVFEAWITRSTASSGGAFVPQNLSDVCRMYIPPEIGDSHFYSASPAECASAKEQHPEFETETPSAFLATLPNPETGACPAGQVPVYRLWNGRIDSNHRYTTTPSVRTEMIEKHYIPEGYGPLGVAMCVAG